MYFAIFTNNIWSYLLWSPVIALPNNSIFDVYVLCVSLSPLIMRHVLRMKNKAIHQQPPIGYGLPGPYGGSSVFGKARLPIFVYRRMSCLASKKRPRLTSPVPSDDGSRKPARPYVWKDTPFPKLAIITSRRVQAVMDQ